jgi:hypothetical protein
LDIPFPFGQSNLKDRLFKPKENKKKKEVLCILKKKRQQNSP